MPRLLSRVRSRRLWQDPFLLHRRLRPRGRPVRPRPDPTLRTELQLPGTNSSAGDGGHYLHHRAQTAPSLVSARPPSQGSMGSSVARLLGSPAPDGVAIYEYPGSRYREPPSGAGQDPGYRSPPAAAEESEPFNAGAFFLVHEETGPVYLDGYYAAGGGARSPLGPPWTLLIQAARPGAKARRSLRATP